ncbi:MAG: PepSY domain-containing protein [Oscillospiraceae bacterium]|nr:PepSY domain-containing protein [Oscillospiraceae bacterium]
MEPDRISTPLPAPDSPERQDVFVRKLYAYAAAALCSEQAAKSAVSEAVITAAGKEPAETAQRETAALKTLIRICTARAAETEPTWNTEQTPALALVKRLPFQSRSDLALKLSELPAETVSEASGLTEKELSDRCGKAMRQLRFLHHGSAPSPADMKQALHFAPFMKEPADALAAEIGEKLAAHQSAGGEEQSDSAPGRIHRISRRAADPAPERTRSVRVPLWGMICGAVLLCGMTAVIAVLALHRPQAPPSDTPAVTEDSGLPAPEYIRQVAEERAPALAGAQNAVLTEAGLSEEDVIFLSTKLSAGSHSPRYTITFLDRSGKQYEYITEGKKVSLQSTSETDDIPVTTGWRSREELRLTAMNCAEIQSAVFTKEKLSTDGDIYYYKFEFTEDGTREYTAYLDVRTAALLRYSVKDADPPDDGSLLPLETAKAKALSRAGDIKPEQVIFTKEKREGTVWMIAFTLDDGTQYSVELNARSGLANAVDVRPVSADTTQLIGMLAAKEAALKRAGLPANSTVRFTKAKVDRSSAAYVYEFEFQTASDEYEATLNAATGELIKYRIWTL